MILWMIKILLYNMENQLIIIGCCTLIVLCTIIEVILSIVSFISKESSKKKINDLHDKIDDFTKNVGNIVSKQSQTLNSGIRGLHGPRGPSGPQGPPGMSYTAAGQLLNMATKTVATPTAGKGQHSIVYLDNKNNSPMQYWFLSNNPDGTVSVQNKYSNRCLNTEDNSSNVFSDACDLTKNTQKFVWNSNMQLLSKSQNGKCISIQDFSRNTGNSTNNLDPTTGQAVANTNNGQVKRILLDDCSSSLNPNQTWFVGH
jgi:hypothetical protein